MGESRSKHHLQISEIFKSIQGEGRLQGELTTFIRTSGCNLRCSWCDTTYAYDGGAKLEIDEIIAEVERLDCRNICLTGGEPLLQENARYLIDALKDAGCFIAVATNGTIDISGFDSADRFTVDYKLPSAQADIGFCQANFAALRAADELKFVVEDRADYKEAKRILGDYRTAGEILMSPCWTANVARDLADWLVRDNLPVRYSLQIHKVIWGVEAKAK